MPTSNGDHVPYGLDNIVPTGTITAWGARLIVTQDGSVDFVGDRQGCAGEQRGVLLTTLNEEFPVHAMNDKISGLLRSGEMNTREAQDFIIHESDRLEVHANTNASAGYCYVTAWPR
jgi:hypothetical protein